MTPRGFETDFDAGNAEFIEEYEDWPEGSSSEIDPNRVNSDQRSSNFDPNFDPLDLALANALNAAVLVSDFKLVGQLAAQLDARRSDKSKANPAAEPCRPPAELSEAPEDGEP